MPIGGQRSPGTSGGIVDISAARLIYFFISRGTPAVKRCSREM